MMIGAYLPSWLPESRDEINKCGEVIAHRTSDLHHEGDDLETFDAVVVLDSDPHAHQVVVDYTPRCKVMRLRFDQLATLGRSTGEVNGSGDEGGHEGDQPAAAEETAEAEEGQPKAPAEEATDLEAMNRPTLLKYAASRYPGARSWLKLDNAALRETIRELGG